MEPNSKTFVKEPGMLRMMFATLLGSLLASSAGAAEEDGVKKTLDAAKAKYKAELEKFKKDVGEWFDSVEELARKDGKKSLVDQIKEERSTFSDFGDLPSDAPARLKKKRTDARAAMEGDYRAAIKGYLKEKKDAEAAAVDKELVAFGEERAGVEAVAQKTLPGTWRISFGGPNGYSSDWTFNESGTVVQQNSKNGGKGIANTNGRWVIDMKSQAVVVTWTNKLQDKLDLPLDPKLSTGSQMHSKQEKLEAVKKR